MTIVTIVDSVNVPVQVNVDDLLLQIEELRQQNEQLKRQIFEKEQAELKKGIQEIKLKFDEMEITGRMMKIEEHLANGDLTPNEESDLRCEYSDLEKKLESLRK